MDRHARLFIVIVWSPIALPITILLAAAAANWIQPCAGAVIAAGGFLAVITAAAMAARHFVLQGEADAE